MKTDFDTSLLSGYLDQELTDAETSLVEQALAERKDLQQELADMRRLRAAIAALPMPLIAPDIVAQVRQRVERQRADFNPSGSASANVDSGTSKTSNLKLFLSLVVAASVVFAVGLATLNFNRNPKQIAGLQRSPIPDEPQQVPPATAESNLLEQNRTSGTNRGIAADTGVSTLAEPDALTRDGAGANAQRMAQAQLGDAAADNAPVADTAVADAILSDPPMSGALAESGSNSLELQPPPQAMQIKTAPQAQSQSAARRSRAENSFAPSALAPDASALRSAPMNRAAKSAPVEQLLQAAFVERGPYDKLQQQAPVASTEIVGDPKTDRQLIVSSLRSDQLPPAIRWINERVNIAAVDGDEAKFDVNTQAIAVSGPASTVARFQSDWMQYLKQAKVAATQRALAFNDDKKDPQPAAGVVIMLRVAD